MEIIIAILAILILATAYLILSPISIYLSFDVGRIKMKSAVIRIFPFKHRIEIGEEKKKIKVKAEKEKIKAKKAEKKRKYNIFPVIIDEYETLGTVIVIVFRFLGGIIKSPDRYYVRISLAGGLGAPDLTGHLCGGIESLRPVLGRSVSISYQPDFLAESMEGDVTAGLVVRIITIIKQLLIFGWRLPKLRLIKIYRKMRKGGGNAK